MWVKDILADRRPCTSVEFFPPKTNAQQRNFLDTLDVLQHAPVDYTSVTYGAGGHTAAYTFETVNMVQQRLSQPVVCHLTCGGSSRQDIVQRLERCRELGIKNILALRGDAPPSPAGQDAFRYAGELVAYIKAAFPEFCVGVAGFPEGHPATPNRLDEIEHLKWKVDQGADYIVSQLFFENRDFVDFRERAAFAGIQAPIVAGLIVPGAWSSLHRICELAAGARVPAPLLATLSRAKDESEALKRGLEWAVCQARDLRDAQDVDGIHWYFLNRPDVCVQIMTTVYDT